MVLAEVGNLLVCRYLGHESEGVSLVPVQGLGFSNFSLGFTAIFQVRELLPRWLVVV